jgi:hypothetical protein
MVTSLCTLSYVIHDDDGLHLLAYYTSTYPRLQYQGEAANRKWPLLFQKGKQNDFGQNCKRGGPFQCEVVSRHDHSMQGWCDKGRKR